MRCALLLSMVFAWTATAQPVPPEGQPARRRIQVMDLHSPDEAVLAETVTKILTVELSHRNFEVLSSRDLAAAASLEADRQAAGCDTSSCLMEIAEAMGADLLAYGDVVRLNKVMLVTLNVFDAKAGKAIGRDQVKVSDLDALPDAISHSLDTMLGVPVRTTTTVSQKGPSFGPVVTMAAASVGALGLLAGGLAYVANGDPASTTLSKDVAQIAFPVAQVAVVVGVVAAAGGAALWVME